MEQARYYILKRTYVNREGNVFRSRLQPFPAEELPNEILSNPLYCSPVLENTEIKVKPLVVNHLEEVHINKAVGGEPVVREIKSQYYETDFTVVEAEPILINEADVKTIMSLEGIGKKTAEKVIELRPFTSIEQLNTLVPLAFGRSWGTYRIKV